MFLRLFAVLLQKSFDMLLISANAKRGEAQRFPALLFVKRFSVAVLESFDSVKLAGMF